MGGEIMPLSERPPKKPRKVKPDGADGHRQRMFDKYLTTIDRDVYPRDVIEMLLYFSIPVRDTRDSAVHLMKRFNNDVQALLNADPKILQETEGVGPSSAMLLNLVGRIGSRLKCEDSDDRPRLMNLDDIFAYFSKRYTNTESDELWIAFFDNSMHPMAYKLKEDTIEMYADDLYELFRLSAIHHSSYFILVRMDSERCISPTITDSQIADYVENSLGGSELIMLDYIIMSTEKIYSLRKRFE